MKFTRHAWGVFRRGAFNHVRGRHNPDDLCGTHKTSAACAKAIGAKMGWYYRRLAKAERNPQ